MTLASASLVLAALAGEPSPPPAPAQQPAPAPARPAPRPPAAPRASLPSVEGDIEEIDHRAHRLRVRTAGGPRSFSFDRNTFVLGPAGALTTLQLSPGARVKVGQDGAERAAWVELKPPPSTPIRAP